MNDTTNTVRVLKPGETYKPEANEQVGDASTEWANTLQDQRARGDYFEKLASGLGTELVVTNELLAQRDKDVAYWREDYRGLVDRTIHPHGVVQEATQYHVHEFALEKKTACAIAAGSKHAKATARAANRRVSAAARTTAAATWGVTRVLIGIALGVFLAALFATIVAMVGGYPPA